jgi:hypothetical protein
LRLFLGDHWGIATKRRDFMAGPMIIILVVVHVDGTGAEAF